MGLNRVGFFMVAQEVEILGLFMGASANGDIFTYAGSKGALYHIMFFYDYSGSSCGYINTAVTNVTDVSSRGSLNTTAKLAIGGVTGGVDNNKFFYCAMCRVQIGLIHICKQR